THFAGENQFPVSWSRDQTALLIGKCYDPVRWDSYWHVEPCPFVMRRLERPDDVIFGTPRLIEAWWHSLAAHPAAYLSHRATFMWQFLGRSNLVLPVWDWLRSGLGLRPQSIFHAARRAPRPTSADLAVSARALARPCRRGRCLRLAGAIDARGSLRPPRDPLRPRLCHDLLRARRGGP